MSIGVWPEFKPKVKSIKPTLDGAPLLDAIGVLDDLCTSLGVSRLGSFGDNRKVPEDFDGHPDELEDLLGPWDEWFTIADGLKTIDALLAALAKPDVKLELKHAKDHVVEELADVARCLRLAEKKKNVKWRLEVVS
jgi:hypothetical protein